MSEEPDSDRWKRAWEELAGSNLARQVGARSAAISHPSLREAALSLMVTHRPFRLADLDFGSEEGERDSLLARAYVRRHDLERILDRECTVVVGARGAGKSAIVRRLVEGREELADGARAASLADVGRRLHALVPNDAWADREQLRAAWLLLVAGEVASQLPSSAPKGLAREGRAILKALGLAPAPSGFSKLAGRLGRLIGGSSLSFAVGPAIIEAKLPSGVSSVSVRSIDVRRFLQESDGIMESADTRLVCLVDETDEVAKYDRFKQESAIQALLQAERDLLSLKRISLIAFLRTDLFDIFDIQEKNKLVSRTMRLDWQDDEWIRLLVERLVSNSGLELVARVVSTEDPADARSLLRTLLPEEMEQRPIDLWLVECLSNGNGDISPRLAVLFLYLTLKHSAHQDEIVTRLPLFTEAALAEAMTELSRLAFEEVVNDFKVATAFVRNSRAAELNDFDVAEVASLFDESEGTVSRQITDLEKLGYLARRVIVQDAQPRVRFRIPPLYRRAWGT